MLLQHYFLIFASAAISGLLVVLGLFSKIKSINVDNKKADRISDAISQGAMTFLGEEYRLIAIVVAFVAGILWYYFSLISAAVFVAGSIISLVAGYLGMKAATMANVRTTMAAKDGGEHEAFLVALFGGGVMGFAVASLGLLGLGALFYLFADHHEFIMILTSFGLGASLVAFFARIGGGIYTKSADVALI